MKYIQTEVRLLCKLLYNILFNTITRPHTQKELYIYTVSLYFKTKYSQNNSGLDLQKCSLVSN